FSKSRSATDPLVIELGELGSLMKQLAETVAAHDGKLAKLTAAAATASPPAAASEPAAPTDTPPAPAAPIQTAGGTPVADPAPAATSVPEVKPAPPQVVTSGVFKGKTEDEIVAVIRDAVHANRIDLYLQPILTLPQRKVRYYEAMTRLRMEDGTLMLPTD